MNYLPFVSWGMYGGTSAAETANLFSSWGMVADLPASSTPTVFTQVTTWFYHRFLKVLKGA